MRVTDASVKRAERLCMESVNKLVENDPTFLVTQELRPSEEGRNGWNSNHCQGRPN